MNAKTHIYAIVGFRGGPLGAHNRPGVGLCGRLTRSAKSVSYYKGSGDKYRGIYNYNP